MRIKKTILQVARLIIIILISVFLLLLLLALIISKPPEKEFNLYHEIMKDSSLTIDVNSEAFKNADFFRDEAYKEWQKQNEKALFKRNYSESKRLIVMAISIAEELNRNDSIAKPPD